MPALPDYLSDWPEVQTLAREIGLGWEEMKAHLHNQGIDAQPYSRIAPDVVWGAMQRELNAGRWWIPERQRLLR